MKSIGFQASALEEGRASEASSGEEYSLVVRQGSVVRFDGDSESELSFAMCIWGEDDRAGLGIHAPSGPKALVGHLAMLLAQNAILRTMLNDACRTAELLAAAEGGD